MWFYRKFIIYRGRTKSRQGLYSSRSSNFSRYAFKGMVIKLNELLYIEKPRNKIVSFLDSGLFPLLLYSFNRIAPLRAYRWYFLFNNLFIESGAHYLRYLGWQSIILGVRGRFNNFLYFYRYLSYIYFCMNQALLVVRGINLYTCESFSFLRKKKYPRRKRRFMRRSRPI